MRKERTRHGLSYPARIGRRFYFFFVSQAIAAATWAEELAVSYPRNDRTASISAGAGVIPRWCYIILYCSGWCGTDAVGGGAGRRPGSIVWGPRRPTGRRVDCVGNPTPKAPGQLIPLKSVQTFLEKLHEKNRFNFLFLMFLFTNACAKKNTCKHKDKHKHKQTPPGAPRGPFD